MTVVDPDPRTRTDRAALGALYGVGLGPGDPELVTIKAARLISEARTIAYFAKRGRPSNARAIAERWFSADCDEILLAYPVTTEIPFEHPDYLAALANFYEESAKLIAARLEAGRDVALLCEGDPMLYGSFMHIHARLEGRFEIEVCAGVSSVSGCSAAARAPLAWGDDVLSVIPATLPLESLVERLKGVDAAAVMKLGGNFPKLRRALVEAGVIDRAIYVERGAMAGEKVIPVSAKMTDDAPYFSLVLVPGRGRRP